MADPPNDSRRCPCCRREVIPVDRALCSYCFHLVPLPLRTDLVHTHRFRVQSPVAHMAALIRLYEWRNENFVGEES